MNPRLPDSLLPPERPAPVGQIRGLPAARFPRVRGAEVDPPPQDCCPDPRRLAEIGLAASSFAHEVANPLNGMYIQAQLLRQETEALGSAVVSLRVQQMLDEMERLNRLLSDFRATLRGAPHAVGARIDVRTVIERAVSFVELDPRIVVEQALPADLPLLGNGADLAQQVFVNLIKNALEAMPNGGTLSLAARREGGWVLVDIGDTGCGVGLGVDPFVPFRTSKKSGTGLGLLIARRGVASLGGTLTFRSVPGRGTTFTVALPTRASPSLPVQAWTQ